MPSSLLRRLRAASRCLAGRPVCYRVAICHASAILAVDQDRRVALIDSALVEPRGVLLAQTMPDKAPAPDLPDVVESWGRTDR